MLSDHPGGPLRDTVASEGLAPLGMTAVSLLFVSSKGAQPSHHPRSISSWVPLGSSKEGRCCGPGSISSPWHALLGYVQLTVHGCQPPSAKYYRRAAFGLPSLKPGPSPSPTPPVPLHRPHVHSRKAGDMVHGRTPNETPLPSDVHPIQGVYLRVTGAPGYHWAPAPVKGLSPRSQWRLGGCQRGLGLRRRRVWAQRNRERAEGG